MLDTLNQKISFILELEKLKGVLRKTRPIGLDRRENSAEHSWHVTLTALVLLEDAPAELDALKVLKMLLVHDVVEIDAGDVFVYDTQGRADVADAEEAAAQRIFGLLPDPLGADLLALWREFEAAESAEALFAKAMDRVNPVLQNCTADTSSWEEMGIGQDRVLAVNERIGAQVPDLWVTLKTKIEAVFANL
ncbi:MAG: HD domain-containing protein [Pseudomonadota bacterium]